MKHTSLELILTVRTYSQDYGKWWLSEGWKFKSQHHQAVGPWTTSLTRNCSFVFCFSCKLHWIKDWKNSCTSGHSIGVSSSTYLTKLVLPILLIIYTSPLASSSLSLVIDTSACWQWTHPRGICCWKKHGFWWQSFPLTWKKSGRWAGWWLISSTSC